MMMTVGEAFQRYEAVRHRLPDCPSVSANPVNARDLGELAEHYDTFLLDAFGVLNIGDTAIAGAPERVASLKGAGKRVLVLSNAASVPAERLLKKYRGMGFDFGLEDIISSRVTLASEISDKLDMHWGVMSLDRAPIHDLGPLSYSFLEDAADTYASSEGFMLLGSGSWSEDRQTMLEEALISKPRPLVVANPDIVAPRETGFSVEPGHFAHILAERAGTSPIFYGKPFRNIFDLAFQRFPDADPRRTIMVGDSLHTDILGARAYGIASALIVQFGFFAEGNAQAAIQSSGILPDFIVERP